MILTLKKSKPLYKAGKMFGWKGAGVGVNYDHFKQIKLSDWICFDIDTKKDLYFIQAVDAIQIINKYNAWKRTRKGNVLVGYLPMFELRNEMYLREQLKLL